jgi:nucleoside-diphosphate-sugar epimerase
LNRSVLVIGGTRNLGHFTALHFLGAGDRVAVLNRGMTADELPAAVERIRADRTVPAELQSALAGRRFDLVIDTALYTGSEAEQAVDILHGRIGRYVFISTGQVYLVRTGLEAPFAEDDYVGEVMPEPDPGTRNHDGWLYGFHKREAEDRLSAACERSAFPVTTLRLPMVHSERDHYDRVRNLLARMMDGGPLVVPDGPERRLRHVWVHDVVSAIGCIGDMRGGVGRAYNLSQDETVTLEAFVGMFAARVDRAADLVRVPRELLTSRNLLPDCAPFSGRWMSELDNRRSVEELGASYTPLPEVVDALVADYLRKGAVPPVGYNIRPQELAIAAGADG